MFLFTYVSKSVNKPVTRFFFRFKDGEDVPTFTIPNPKCAYHHDSCVGLIPLANKHNFFFTVRVRFQYVQVGAYLQHAKILINWENSDLVVDFSIIRERAMAFLTELERAERQCEATL